ncbi:MAG: manganese catalase family protein [Firmicutes bacterium]|nr:manganese catalase family protein [Bacillota bacterium]
MFIYEKKLQCPVHITRPNPALAKLIVTQYGGPDGELGASLRYLSQRFNMVTNEAKATLTDVGTEELGHMEIVGAMVQQLTRDLDEAEIKKNGYDAFYVEHGLGVYPQSAGGVAFNAAGIQSKGDPIADIYENLAAEQKARVTYEYLLDMIGSNNEEVARPLRFLREREIVHFQRFGESLNYVRDFQMKRHIFYGISKGG